MRKLIIAFCCLFITGISLAQEVANINRPYVLLRLSPASGMKSGEVYPILRRLPSGDTAEVGKVKILFYRNNLCATRIVEEDKVMGIMAGDRIFSKRMNSGSAPAEQSVQFSRFTFLKSPLMSYTAVGAGLIAAGLGYHYWDRAEQVANTIPTNMSQYYDLNKKVNTYDKRSNTLQVVSGSLIVIGIVHYFFLRETNYSTDNNVVLSMTGKEGYSAVGVSFAIK